MTSAAELEQLIRQTLWELSGAQAAIEVLLILHDGFAEETKSASGVNPDRRSIPVRFRSELRFVQRFSSTRGDHRFRPRCWAWPLRLHVLQR